MVSFFPYVCWRNGNCLRSGRREELYLVRSLVAVTYKSSHCQILKLFLQPVSVSAAPIRPGAFCPLCFPAFSPQPLKLKFGAALGHMEERQKPSDASSLEKLAFGSFLYPSGSAPLTRHSPGWTLSFQVVTDKIVWGYDSYQPYKDLCGKRSMKCWWSHSVCGKNTKTLPFIINNFPARFH